MKPTIQNVFATELSLISDPDIRFWVVDIFSRLCPDYFWYIPASVRGHHLPICRTRGGLVHHTKLAVAFANTFLDMHDLTGLVYAQTIAGVLLHDMMKRGRTENELDTWPNHAEANKSHGRYCADRLREDMNARGFDINYGYLLNIIVAVQLHMGRWTWEITPAEQHELNKNVVVRTTHLADYAASRALHQYLSERAVDPTMRYLNY